MMFKVGITGVYCVFLMCTTCNLFAPSRKKVGKDAKRKLKTNTLTNKNFKIVLVGKEL